MCDCSEERDRRAREQARKEAARARRLAELAEMSDSDLFDGLGAGPAPPRFNLLHIALGTAGFLCALIALMLKLCSRKEKEEYKRKSGCFDPGKSKWPPTKPPNPPCKPPQPRRC